MPEAKKNPLLVRLGARVRELRTARGLSQLDMVRRFEISLSHFQKIERGVLDCRLTTIARLAEAFEVDLAELLRKV
jgi:hypothetical protein